MRQIWVDSIFLYRLQKINKYKEWEMTLDLVVWGEVQKYS